MHTDDRKSRANEYVKLVASRAKKAKDIMPPSHLSSKILNKSTEIDTSVAEDNSKKTLGTIMKGYT